MSNEIEDLLKESGFAERDIKLGQKLTKRGLESHLNLVDRIKDCERCALSLECHGQIEDSPIVTTNRVIGTGPWNSPLMVIGGMPGEHEGKYSVPFLGVEGQLLALILAKAGIDRNAIYMTYGMKCAGTRNPLESEMKMCSRHILSEIEAVRPQVILTVGELAMTMVRTLPGLDLKQERGKVIPMGDKSIIHTHDMSKMLAGPDQLQFKTEVWQDVSLAVTSVKKARPDYNYDRVGLNTI